MNRITKYKRWFGLAFWLWLAIILVVTLIPQSKNFLSNEESEIRIDYLIHFLVYFNLALLFSLWRISQLRKTSTRELFLYFATGILICILTEYLQKLILGRTFNYYDALFNLFGLIFGFLLFQIKKKHPKKGCSYNKE